MNGILDDGVLKIICNWSGTRLMHLILGEGDVHMLHVNPILLEWNKGRGSEELFDFVSSVTHFIVELGILMDMLITMNLIPTGAVSDYVPCSPDYSRRLRINDDGSAVQWST